MFYVSNQYVDHLEVARQELLPYQNVSLILGLPVLAAVAFLIDDVGVVPLQRRREIFKVAHHGHELFLRDQAIFSYAVLVFVLGVRVAIVLVQLVTDQQELPLGLFLSELIEQGGAVQLV